MQVRALRWNEDGDKETTTVEATYCNKYGEEVAEGNHVLRNGLIYYCDNNTIRLDDGAQPVQRKGAAKNTTYYRLTVGKEAETEKAFAICVGSNGCIGKGLRTFLEWIPKSQCKESAGETFVSAFIANKLPIGYVDREARL